MAKKISQIIEFKNLDDEITETICEKDSWAAGYYLKKPGAKVVEELTGADMDATMADLNAKIDAVASYAYVNFETWVVYFDPNSGYKDFTPTYPNHNFLAVDKDDFDPLLHDFPQGEIQATVKTDGILSVKEYHKLVEPHIVNAHFNKKTAVDVALTEADCKAVRGTVYFD